VPNIHRRGPLLALLLVLTLIGVPSSGLHAQSAPTFNYGEALQKSLWFYEAQQAGPKPSTNRVTWRGDAALTDGADIGRDLTGGWFDAGDHVKFGFPMAAATTMLAWGGVEYRDAYQSSGQLQFLLNNLRFVDDYLIKAHTASNELVGQVGTGGTDHAFWGPPEVLNAKGLSRPTFKITLSCPGPDLAGETAAAMAASSMVFRATDAAYADTLLTHARQLFAFTEATVDFNDASGKQRAYSNCITDAAGFYNSTSGSYWDEVAWAAVWLFRATNDATFLTKARQYYALMGKENQSSTPVFTWTQGWNDKAFGTYVLMSKLTGEAQFQADAQRWLDFWSIGGGRRSPGGVIAVDVWGTMRYAANTAFLALVYADFLTPSNALYARYHDFALRQINYILGANPRNSSYVVGFGSNPPLNVHHRAAHGSWTNNISTPTDNRHVLYGALVGGPTDDVSYNPADRGDFQKNEVATDYNAGFTGALARLYREFGGTPLANFPPRETPDDAEMFVEASINASGTNFTEIKAIVTNKSAWPARELKNGLVRYFFSLEPGVSVTQITLSSAFNQCSAPSGPVLWNAATATYYVQVSCAGQDIFPGGQSESRREMQFRMTSASAWDPTNDWSFSGLPPNPGATPVRTSRIAVYDNGTKVWGDEPPTGGTVVPTSTPTPVVATSTPTRTPTAVVGATSTPTATASASASCAVTYALVNQFNNTPTSGGFQVNLTITNTGSTTINGWTLTFAFPNGQTITSLWNAAVSQSGANVTISSNQSWNATITPGGAMNSVGFNGSWSGTNGVPTSFSVNGVVCK
jgi:endoglucanase